MRGPRHRQVQMLQWSLMWLKKVFFRAFRLMYVSYWNWYRFWSRRVRKNKILLRIYVTLLFQRSRNRLQSDDIGFYEFETTGPDLSSRTRYITHRRRATWTMNYKVLKCEVQLWWSRDATSGKLRPQWPSKCCNGGKFAFGECVRLLCSVRLCCANGSHSLRRGQFKVSFV